MKIRIKGNSIRLRLSKSDVSILCTTGLIKEQTSFGTGSFEYMLKTDDHINTLDATVAPFAITVLIAPSLVEGWGENNKVGFDHRKPLESGDHLVLLVEKDFKCIDAEVLEDQSDNYENPLHSCQ